MSLITPTPLSEKELRLAAERPGVEFVDGELREKPMSVESGRVAGRIVFHLAAAAMPSKAGSVFTESTGYRCFADDATRFRKPDVSFVRTERLPSDLRDIALMPVPADLAVEVISPHDVAYDVEEKVAEYLAAGFGTVWTVYPNVRTVRVHRVGEPSRECRGDDEITGEPFLPTFRCSVRSFFE